MIALNNVLNIRYSKCNKWRGQIGSKKGFCIFSDVKYCYRAAAIMIGRSYRRAGAVSLHDIISRFAPDTENKTDDYIRFVCHAYGCDEYLVIDNLWDLAHLLYYMSIFEVGRKNVMCDVLGVYGFLLSFQDVCALYDRL